MDGDDQDMGFTASLLSYCVERGGLTDKQVKHARRIVERVRALWLARQLDCQQPAPGRAEPVTHLMSLAAVGTA